MESGMPGLEVITLEWQGKVGQGASGLSASYKCTVGFSFVIRKTKSIES